MYAYYAMTGMIPRETPTNQDGKPLAPSQVNNSNNPAAAPAPASNSKTASASKGKKSSIQKVKAFASVTITPLQILQMVVGSFAIFHTHRVCPDKQYPVFTIFGGVMYAARFPRCIFVTLCACTSPISPFLSICSRGKSRRIS
jgi:hypothetical protein